ncbi:hypothetical protein RRG08_009334 [Elysia crispata]|uniref:Uncharacterized protein n=1 Tax=Elysia crispata TaxID=231223 RepID=A0AAE0Y4I4_9GAST|nr:hypothetical protein RRG08_009334 [Elysia crispata]
MSGRSLPRRYETKKYWAPFQEEHWSSTTVCHRIQSVLSCLFCSALSSPVCYENSLSSDSLADIKCDNEDDQTEGAWGGDKV